MATIAARPTVVGFDGSADSRAALAWAVRHVVPDRGPIDVVIAVSDLARLSAWNREWSEGLATEREEAARSLLTEADEENSVIRRVIGSPTQVLVDASERASLLVVGSRGHGPLAELLIGSVSQHVAQYAACPVVVVREPKDPTTSRVVVGVDGSEDSRRALRFGLEQARATGGELLVVHGWKWVSDPARVAEDAPGRARAMDAARRALDDWVTDETDDFPDVESSQRLVDGSVRRALVGASEEAALVVLGARGVGAFRGMLLGSVSNYLLHHADCPVAVVR